MAYFLPIMTEQILPTSLTPKRYDVKLRIVPHTEFKDGIYKTDFTLSGNVCIKFVSNGKTNEIKLHGKRKYLTLEDKSKMTLRKDTEKQYMNIQDTIHDSDSDVLTLKAYSLGKGKYELCIPYKGEINEENEYIIWKDKLLKQYIIATNFEKQNAFPCFDEPSMRALFNLEYIIPKRNAIYANEKCVNWEDDDLQDETAKHICTISSKMPPSQISFVITSLGDSDIHYFDYKFSLHWHVTFSHLFESLKEIKLEERIQEVKVENKLNDLGPFYSFPRVHVVILPTKQKIRSFTWGLVLMREIDITNVKQDEMIYNIFVRLTSQWFGSMVSPNNWDSLWIFKALASYVAYLEMQTQVYVDHVSSLMWQKQRYDLDYNIEKGIDPFLSTTVNHEKGISLLRMVHLSLGTKNFLGALSAFLRVFQYRDVEVERVWGAFSVHSQDPFRKSLLPYEVDGWKDVMASWYKEGYPVITVKRFQEGHFEITQEPIMRRTPETGTNAEDADCWFFPVAHVTPKKPVFKMARPNHKTWSGCGEKSKITLKLLNEKEKKDMWVIFNFNYVGPYRVKYDDVTFGIIVETIKSDQQVFPPRIRAQLVNDAMALAWLGRADYDYTFKLLPYLENETNNIVWRVFFLGATNLEEILRNSGTHKRLLDFLGSFLTKAFQNHYGERMEVFNPESTNREMVPSKIDTVFFTWACNVVRLQSCRTKALQLLDEFISKDIVPDTKSGCKRALLSTMLCTALDEIGKGGNTEGESGMKRVDVFFDFLQKKELKSREMFINAVKCISDKNSINGLLKWTTEDDKITNKEEKLEVFLELTRGVDSYQPTLHYFEENIHAILSQYQNSNALSRIVYSLASKMNAQQLAKLRSFIMSTAGLNKNEILNSFKKGEALANQKIKWLSENEPKVRAALQRLSF